MVQQWGSGIELPILACWCVVIGGITNPSIFVVAALGENFWDKAFWKVVAGISFVITTVGFVGIGYTFMQHYLAV